MVIDDLEGSATFCDPAYNFRTVRAKGMLYPCQMKCGSDVPCLYFGVLTVTVHHFPFA